MEWMDEIKNVTGLSLNDIKKLVQHRKYWRSLRVQNRQNEEKNQCLI